uniref:Uncharacterized protein n=1 Tax=Timema cristinae TaxID=61476 RepID=A0A7R9D5Q8_TIMCR|nr:unnamed protein product [Timema cristinae]
MWPDVLLLVVHSLDGEIGIQDIDGGFFEKFGSLLREHQDRALEEEYLPRTTSSSSVEKDRKDEEAEESLEDEQTLHDSDSEPEQTDKEQLISDAMGWNHSGYLGGNVGSAMSVSVTPLTGDVEKNLNLGREGCGAHCCPLKLCLCLVGDVDEHSLEHSECFPGCQEGCDAEKSPNVSQEYDSE